MFCRQILQQHLRICQTAIPTDIHHAIVKKVQQKNPADIWPLLLELEDYYAARWIPFTSIRLHIIDLYLSIIGLAAQKDHSPSSGLNAKELLTVTNAQTLRQLLETVHTWVVNCILSLAGSDEIKPPQYLVDCRSYMEEHYMEELSLPLVAQKLFMNADYLSRMLKNQYGQTFTQILADIRLEHACILLADVNLSISDVAIQCGFRDFLSFGQLFKAHYGQTPRDYRKNIKNWRNSCI